MPFTKSRIVGSGFSTLSYRGQPIAFLASFNDGGQKVLGGTEAVWTLGDKFATEIAAGRVLDIGSLSITIRELWNGPVWQQLSGLENANDIIDVYDALAADPTEVTCQMLIKPPGGAVWRGKIYHSCVVVAIDDTEQVTLDALTVARRIDLAYTHIERFTMNASS